MGKIPILHDKDTAETLKKLRAVLCLNQREFAEKFHIPYGTYSQWETKRRQPPEYVIQLIVDIIEKDNLIENYNNTSTDTDLGVNIEFYTIVEKIKNDMEKKIKNSEFKHLAPVLECKSSMIPVRLHVGDNIVRGFLEEENIRKYYLHTVNSYEVCCTEWGVYIDVCLNNR